MGSAFPAFSGHASMYDVHAFMDLGPEEVGYFITQVANSAASFGVTDDDLKVVGAALNGLFANRCSPPATAIPAQGPQLQAICIDAACPIASPTASCAAYNNSVAAVPPKNHTGAAGSGNSTTTSSGTATKTGGSATLTSGSGHASSTSSTTATGGTTSPTSVSTSGGAAVGMSFLALVAGFAALVL